MTGGAAGQGGAPGGTTGAGGGQTGTQHAKALQQLQSDYVDMRFGMFMHFGILTFCGSQPGNPCKGSWAQPNLAINNFAPSAKYDPTPMGGYRGRGPHEVRRAHHAPPRRVRAVAKRRRAISTSATSRGRTARATS